MVNHVTKCIGNLVHVRIKHYNVITPHIVISYYHLICHCQSKIKGHRKIISNFKDTIFHYLYIGTRQYIMNSCATYNHYPIYFKKAGTWISITIITYTKTIKSRILNYYMATF